MIPKLKRKNKPRKPTTVVPLFGRPTRTRKETGGGEPWSRDQLGVAGGGCCAMMMSLCHGPWVGDLKSKSSR